MFKTVKYCSRYVFAENITLQGVEVILGSSYPLEFKKESMSFSLSTLVKKK
jgi:hypothetical protein